MLAPEDDEGRRAAAVNPTVSCASGSGRAIRCTDLDSDVDTSAVVQPSPHPHPQILGSLKSHGTAANTGGGVAAGAEPGSALEVAPLRDEPLDLTSTLPDELLIAIFLRLPPEFLAQGGCARVCRRWRAVAEVPSVRGYAERAWRGESPAARLARTARHSKSVEKWQQYYDEIDPPVCVCTYDKKAIFHLAASAVGVVCTGARHETTKGPRFRIRVWSVNASHESTRIGTIVVDGEVTAMAVAPTGLVFTASELLRDVSVWNHQGDLVRSLRVFDEPSYCPSSIMFDGMGPNVHVFHEYGVKVFDHGTGKPLGSSRLPSHVHTAITCGAIGPERSRVYLGAQCGSIFALEGGALEHLYTIDTPAGFPGIYGVEQLAVSPTGTLYSYSLGADDISVWDGQTGAAVRMLPIMGLRGMHPKLVCTTDGLLLCTYGGTPNHDMLYVWTSDDTGNTCINEFEDDIAPSAMAVGSNGTAYLAFGNCIEALC